MESLAFKASARARFTAGSAKFANFGMKKAGGSINFGHKH
jgi:hypothetical protein